MTTNLMSDEEMEKEVLNIIEPHYWNIGEKDREAIKTSLTYKTLMQLIISYADKKADEARIDEHDTFVLPAVEKSHIYEQEEQESGIQYFDDLRSHRIAQLREGVHKK